MIKWHNVEIVSKKTLEKIEGRWVKADKAKSLKTIESAWWFYEKSGLFFLCIYMFNIFSNLFYLGNQSHISFIKI